MKLLSLALLLAVAALGQTTGPANTKGACSPAVSGSGNKITIETCGLTDEQVAEWRTSFHRILEKQVDPKVLVALLDDIKSGQIRIEDGVLRIETKVTEIENHQADWHLTAEQSSQLVDALKGLHAKVSIHALISDRNAGVFATDLQAPLKDFNGGKEPGFFNSALVNANLKGVGIIIGHSGFPEAEALLKALKAVGLEAQEQIDDKFPQDVITIFIGAKP